VELDSVADRIWSACRHGSTVEQIAMEIASSTPCSLAEGVAATAALICFFVEQGFAEIIGPTP